MPTTDKLDLLKAKLAISRRYAAHAVDNLDPERQDRIDRRPPPLLEPEVRANSEDLSPKESPGSGFSERPSVRTRDRRRNHSVRKNFHERPEAWNTLAGRWVEIYPSTNKGVFHGRPG